MHGGYGNFVLGDLYALDLSSMHWRELPALGSPKLQGHCLMVHNGYLWLSGGTDEADQPHLRLWRLDLASCLARPGTPRWGWSFICHTVAGSAAPQ